MIFSINDVSIAAKTWGKKNNTPVIAIHGWLDNADSFSRIAPEIANSGEYVVAIDLVGHGSSSHRPLSGSYYLWEYAADLMRIFQNNNWKTVKIIAHSMGTGVASIIASSFPKVVERMAFIDGLGAPFVMKDDMVTHFQRSFRQLEMIKKMGLNKLSSETSALFRTREEAIQERMKSNISKLPYSVIDQLVDRSLKLVHGGYSWKYDERIVLPEHLQLTEDQAQLFLQKIKCPVEIFLGDSGLFTTEKALDRISAIEKTNVHRLPGSHHLHLEDSSEQISKTIIQFFQHNNPNKL